MSAVLSTGRVTSTVVRTAVDLGQLKLSRLAKPFQTRKWDGNLFGNTPKHTENICICFSLSGYKCMVTFSNIPELQRSLDEPCSMVVITLMIKMILLERQDCAHVALYSY